MWLHGRSRSKEGLQGDELGRLELSEMAPTPPEPLPGPPPPGPAAPKSAPRMQLGAVGLDQPSRVEFELSRVGRCSWAVLALLFLCRDTVLGWFGDGINRRGDGFRGQTVLSGPAELVSGLTEVLSLGNPCRGGNYRVFMAAVFPRRSEKPGPDLEDGAAGVGDG